MGYQMVMGPNGHLVATNGHQSQQQQQAATFHQHRPTPTPFGAGMMTGRGGGQQASHQQHCTPPSTTTGRMDINSALRRGTAAMRQENFSDDDLDLIITAMKDREPMERPAIQDFLNASNNSNRLSQTMKVGMEALKMGLRQRLSCQYQGTTLPGAISYQPQRTLAYFAERTPTTASSAFGHQSVVNASQRPQQNAMSSDWSQSTPASSNFQPLSSVRTARQQNNNNTESSSTIAARFQPPECCVCLEALDISSRKPCLCINCGNSVVCLACVGKFDACPFCRHPMPSKPVINRGLLEILERLAGP